MRRAVFRLPSTVYRYGFEGVSIRGISQVIIGILSVIEIDRHNNELLVLERQDHPVHPYPQGE